MSTFNLYSPFGYEKLVKKVYDFKVKHFNTERYWNSPLILDTSYLRYPSFLSFRVLKGYLGVHYFERLEKLMKFFSSYRSLNSYNLEEPTDSGFSLKEIEKITRLKEYYVSQSNIKLKDKNDKFFTDLKNFKEFITQYQIRRNLDCFKYFPELTNFIEKIN
jgi:hypothetical protein